MREKISIDNIMSTLIPISRFNKGEAGKIFEEVKKDGTKLVIKNNEPSCILLDPNEYEVMREALEDYALYFEAEQRMKNARTQKLTNEVVFLKELGLSEKDLEDVEVEIE